MMQRHAGRLAGGLLLLAAVWISTYWLWPAEPAISFAREAPAPPLAPAPILPQPDPAVLPPEFDTHVVRAGESLDSIARDRYGTTDHAASIARANPMADPARMRPGRTLRLPRDPSNIQGRPADAASPTPMAQDLERRHVVRAGDSLSKISVELFGTPRHAAAIFQANRAVLPNEHSLRPGQTLRIPPRPRENGRS